MERAAGGWRHFEADRGDRGELRKGRGLEAIGCGGGGGGSSAPLLSSPLPAPSGGAEPSGAERDPPGTGDERAAAAG